MPKGERVDLEQLKQRRVAARELLAEGLPQAEVARRLQVSRQSVSRWAQLSAKRVAQVRPMGRKARVSASDVAWLKAALLKGAGAHGFATELWTLSRIAEVWARHTGHRFSTTQMWRRLHGLGFSCQRPAGRARERAPQAVEQWREKTWPDVKKKP